MLLKERKMKELKRVIFVNCPIFMLYCWDAWTRLPGQRTRVRRGRTRRRGWDAADRASVLRRATWRFPNRADAAEIGPTRSVLAETA